MDGGHIGYGLPCHRSPAISPGSAHAADRLASHASAGISSRCAPAATAAAVASGEQRTSHGDGGRGSGRSQTPARRSYGGGDEPSQQQRRRQPQEYGDSGGGGAAGGRGSGRGGRGRGGGRQQRPAPASKAAFFTSQSFKAAGASPEMVEALKGLGITRPSHIQVQFWVASNTERDLQEELRQWMAFGLRHRRVDRDRLQVESKCRSRQSVPEHAATSQCIS